MSHCQNASSPRSRSFSQFLKVFLAAWILISGSSIFAAEFEVAYRDRSDIYLLSTSGDGIYLPQPAGPPKRILSFSDAAGNPFRWKKQPSGLARWRSQWVVADSTNLIARFTEKGVLAGFTDLPARASSLATPGREISFVNPLADKPSLRLWHSADGKKFLPVPPAAGDDDTNFANPSSNLIVVAGAPDGSLYFIPIFGQPVLRRVLQPPAGRILPIAYSRTKFRASLDEIVGDPGDVTRYSLPVRDLLPLDGGSIVVLRNREDIPSPSGRPQTIQALRADRYDPAGKHLATATFRQSVRWIVAAQNDVVIGITREGATVVASWGKPIAGVILP